MRVLPEEIDWMEDVGKDGYSRVAVRVIVLRVVQHLLALVQAASESRINENSASAFATVTTTAALPSGFARPTFIVFADW